MRFCGPRACWTFWGRKRKDISKLKRLKSLTWIAMAIYIRWRNDTKSSLGPWIANPQTQSTPIELHSLHQFHQRRGAFALKQAATLADMALWQCWRGARRERGFNQKIHPGLMRWLTHSWGISFWDWNELCSRDMLIVILTNPLHWRRHVLPAHTSTPPVFSEFYVIENERRMPGGPTPHHQPGLMPGRFPNGWHHCGLLRCERRWVWAVSGIAAPRF